VKQQHYLQKIIDQIVQYSRMNFGDILEIPDNEEADHLVRVLAVGVNIMGEELEHKVKELEERNRFIHSVTSSVPELIFVYDKVKEGISYLNKCTSSHADYPCPVMIMGSDSPCRHCTLKDVFKDIKSKLVVEQLSEDEIKINLFGIYQRWYKITRRAFETNAQGEVLNTLHTLTDISLLKGNEAQVAEALKEKELLLQEVHHRVKNNLHTVSAIISMQLAAASAATQQELKEIKTRIDSIALIHEELYKTDNFIWIDFSNYCVKLCRSLSYVYEKDHVIAFEFNLEPDVFFTMDRVRYIGLFLNEVICNAYKHSRFADEKGKITLSLSLEPDAYVLEVRDNGEKKIHRTEEGGNNVGTKLILAMAKQLHGEITIRSEAGYAIMLKIPLE
jgi:two-component sensor histidine kinase